MNDFIWILFTLAETHSAKDLSGVFRDLPLTFSEKIKDVASKDTFTPLERAYDAAGAPFGSTTRALLLWIRFQQQTTSN